MAGGWKAQQAWQQLLELLGQYDRSFLEGPRAAGFQEIDVAEGYRHMAHLLSFGFDLFLESDPDRPQFVPLALPTKKILGDNVDSVYHYTNVNGLREYRIVGRRGDDCYLSFQVHAGGEPGNHLAQRTVGHLNHTDMATGPGDTFEIIVSKERHSGNWLALSDDAACIITREYYFDRANDRRAEFTIEPLVDPGPPPPLTDEVVAERLRAVTTFLAITEATVPMPMTPVNQYAEPFRFRTDMPSWGTPDNVYCRCFFDLEPDQALVIEGEMISCVYWGMQLWNPFMQSLDYRWHRTSVNNQQAGLVPGDRFRVVVAHEDPGEPIWLDTAGHHSGAVFARWLLPDHDPPVPTATVVPLTDLRSR